MESGGGVEEGAGLSRGAGGGVGSEGGVEEESGGDTASLTDALFVLEFPCGDDAEVDDAVEAATLKPVAGEITAESELVLVYESRF